MKSIMHYPRSLWLRIAQARGTIFAGSIRRFYLDVHLPRFCIAYKNLFPPWITLKHRSIRMLMPQEKRLPWLWSGYSMHRWNHFVMVTTSQFCIISSPGFDTLIQPENVI